jgi:hypothetical protein
MSVRSFELRRSAVERNSLLLKVNSAERLSHTSQQQQQQQHTLLQNKHSIGIHLRVTDPKFERAVRAYVWMFYKNKKTDKLTLTTQIIPFHSA